MTPPTDDLSAVPVARFLDRLAEKTPTPGGGSVAALTAALSCALARMVAAYSKPPAQPLAKRLHNADLMLRKLLSEDIAAYQALSATQAEAKADPAKEPQRQDALLTAALVPLEIAATATTALAAMDELKSLANKGLLCDLVVAASVGEAAVRAAGGLVRINLADVTDAARTREPDAEIQRLAARAARLRASIEAFVP